MQKKVPNKLKSLQGTVTIPSDKSISHRAVILSSLARGKSVIENFSTGQDPKSSLEVCKMLGVKAEFKNNKLIINSNAKFTPTSEIYNCGNSGTTMRLMAGILAGQNFTSTLTGDESLSSRPMKRIIEPLTLMGAKILSNDFKAPLKITGRELNSINYTSKIASAQVKSCILLAGLGVNSGITSITEPCISRNHTELMLKAMDADITVKDTTISIQKSDLTPLNITIPGDISSAAYFIAAGLIVPNAKIIIKDIGLNPTRTGIIDIVRKMDGNIEILDQKETGGELIGDIKVEYSDLKACKISGDIIPRLIDEIPAIAVLATQAEGETVISDAKDLRNKESDRITTVVEGLKTIGADITETPDGMIIRGKTPLLGGKTLNTYHDHRLAMSFYVAGLICQKEILIDGFEWVNISFPDFEKLFNSLF